MEAQFNKEKVNNADINSSMPVKEKLRPCCACKETKQIRDNCIFDKGEENCFKFIDDHKKCLQDLGFITD